MIYELRAGEYEKARTVCRGLDDHLAVRAIIRGDSPGRVWMDDARHPESAFIWDRSHGFYLVGREDNAEFQMSLRQVITEEIYPEALERPELLCFTLYYSPDAWERGLGIVLEDKFPMKDRRRLYVFKQLKVKWREGVPDDFRMERVDAKLVQRSDLKNLDRVIGEIDGKQWNSIEDFLRKGFGFCLLHVQRGEIVSWCLSEYNGESRCELGIETDERYRRRGFATLTASACVEHCLASGMTYVGWHCWDNNVGSIGVAEKVGFENALDYPVYFAWFDKVDNLAVNGNMCLRREELEEAVAWYGRAFEAGEAKSWAYYNAACAWALLGKGDAAIWSLNQAVDRGWRDVELLRGDDDLESLHAVEGWEELIGRL